MPEIKRVIVIVANPVGPDDPGRVSFGFYRIDGNKLIMTDGDGKPVRRAHGELVQHTLEAGDDPDVIARRLTREFRQHIHGSSVPGFSGPIRYRNRGWR